MKLKITIAGPVKSGKSTVAYLVKQALDNAGFSTTLGDDDPPIGLENTALRRIAALSEKKLHVDIEVVQTANPRLKCTCDADPIHPVQPPCPRHDS